MTLTVALLLALLYSSPANAGARRGNSATESTLPKPTVIVTETSLGAKPADLSSHMIYVGPDARHIWYMPTNFEHQTLIVDGKNVTPEGNYHLSGTPFSPDGKRVAFVTSHDKMVRLNVDGVAGKLYEEHIWFKFSPDSKRIAFGAWRNSDNREKWEQFIVLDGVELKAYSKVDEFFFSPGSDHFAFRATQNLSRSVAQARLAPGTTVDALVEEGGESFWVVDGKEGKHHPIRTMDSFAFSPDGKRLGYRVKIRENQRMILIGDNLEGVYEDRGQKEDNDSESRELIVFSPDSKHVAYWARRDGQEFVVRDGVEGAKFKELNRNSLKFSADSQHLAYIASSGGNTATIVLDAKQWTPFAYGISGGSGGISFSADSQHLAAIVTERNTGFVLFDNVRVAEHPHIGVTEGVNFLPGGGFAYAVAPRRGPWHVVMGDKRGADFEAIIGNSVCLTPDGKHVVYQARRNGSLRLVIDGWESATYDAFVTESFGPRDPSSPKQYAGVVFENANTLHVVALRGGEYVGLEVKIKD